jgi:hypothetical protein
VIEVIEVDGAGERLRGINDTRPGRGAQEGRRNWKAILISTTMLAHTVAVNM